MTRTPTTLDHHTDRLRHLIRDREHEVHRRVRHRVHGRRHPGHPHPTAGATGERVCRALGRHRPPRVHRPHLDRQRAAPRPRARRVLRSLQRPSTPPSPRPATTTPDAGPATCSHRQGSKTASPGRPDQRIRPGSLAGTGFTSPTRCRFVSGESAMRGTAASRAVLRVRAGPALWTSGRVGGC
jgi:hypothetical protein